MPVPYRMVKCEVRGCTIQHDAYYPYCSKHRRQMFNTPEKKRVVHYTGQKSKKA